MQFISVPILARMLTPDDYGLAAIAMPFVMFAMIIADAGISTSLVRLPNINTRVWHTSFWLLCMAGAAITAVLMAVAPLLAAVFEAPQLTPILLALSSVVFLQAISLVPNSALQHQKSFAIIAGSELAAIILSITLAIVAATHGSGVWALVWQQLVYYVTRTLLTSVFSPYRPSMSFDLRESHEHITFGFNLLCANVVSYLSKSIDNLCIGRALGASQLGLYSIAFQFARLPYMLVTGPIQAALYPHLTAWKHDTMRLNAVFLLLTRLLAVLIFPSSALVAIANRPVFTILLSEKWASAGTVFAVLAAATAVQAVRGVAVTFLMVVGRTDIQRKLSSQFSILWLGSMISTVWFGIMAVASSYTICVVVFSVWSLRTTLPIMQCPAIDYARSYAAPLLTSGLAVTIYKLFAINSSLSDIALIGIVAILSGLATVAAYLLQRDQISSLIQKATLKDKPTTMA